MASSIEVDLNGPVHIVEHGGTGTPILLIHGLGGSHLNWSAVAEPLTKFGSVRAIDLVGFGYTKPFSRSCAVQAQRDLVIDYLREHADAPALLVGNSMGGLISILVAEAAPELVDGLILVDAALPTIRPRLDIPVIKGLIRPLIPGVGPRMYAQAIEDPEAYMDEVFKVLFVDRSAVDAEHRKVALEMTKARAEMPWAGPAFAEAARSLFRVLIRRRAFVKHIESITADALIVHGDKDRLVDVASARWLAKLRPDWQLEIFENVGHVPQLEVPDRLLDVVERWLATRSERVSSSVK
jgi:pimeloyl-ACP methyl ester carboxylesterase